MRPLLFVALVASVMAGRSFAAEQIRIEWLPQARPPAVEIIGVPPETLGSLQRSAPSGDAWASLCAIHVGEKPGAMPAIAGAWRVAGERLRFEPRFPFEPGVVYRAEFRPPDSAPIVSIYQVPARATSPTTIVTGVYPAADVLPENQLKFYVQFSAPMSRGRVYEHVRLRDARGRDIELPFLELDEELWDPAMTRVTLLIDPGRIKRGVRPLEDIGAVFEQGNSYSLVVAAACEDAAGQPLRAAYEKKFRIGPADRVPPDPARWKLTPPKADSREPVVVEFDEPMDHALALRLIAIMRGAGESLDGEVSLADADRRWVFAPRSPWSRGAHELVVATTIEDLAGNNIGKTFDVDLASGMHRRLERATMSVPFEVK